MVSDRDLVWPLAFLLSRTEISTLIVNHILHDAERFVTGVLMDGIYNILSSRTQLYSPSSIGSRPPRV